MSRIISKRLNVRHSDNHLELVGSAKTTAIEDKLKNCRLLILPFVRTNDGSFSHDRPLIRRKDGHFTLRYVQLCYH